MSAKNKELNNSRTSLNESRQNTELTKSFGGNENNTVDISDLTFSQSGQVINKTPQASTNSNKNNNDK